MHAKLSRAVATVPEFTATFGSTAWFEDKVLWLAPDPAEPFRALTASVAAAFPEHPPYEGAHDDVVPHLTVGQDAPPRRCEQSSGRSSRRSRSRSG